MQTNLKQVLAAHSETLRDIRGFWRELCSKRTTFVSLSEVRSRTLQAILPADKAVLVAMWFYPGAPSLVNKYAKLTHLAVMQAFTQMHQSETHAEEIYKIVIQKYPKSVKILRAYVRFLREIKNDPWKAQKYDLQADNYEQVVTDISCCASNQAINHGKLHINPSDLVFIA